jgi:hypothetical protein
MKQGSKLQRAAFSLVAGLWAISAGPTAAEEGAPSSTPSELASVSAPAQAARSYRWGVGWDEGLALRARLGHGWGLGLRINPDLIDPEDESSSTQESVYEWQCMGTRTCRREYESRTESEATGDMRTFSGSLMLFHERKLGKWLAAGPYVAVNYDRWSFNRTEETKGQWESRVEYPTLPPQSTSRSEETGTVKTRGWDRKIGLELGVRPTFRFHDRFILETRFGLELGFTRWNESQESVYERQNDYDCCIYRAPAGLEVDVVAAPAQQPSAQEKTERKGSERRFRTVGERLGTGAELRFVILF